MRKETTQLPNIERDRVCVYVCVIEIESERVSESVSEK